MNYKIIGGDQKEYGPVTAEQLRQWVTEGRVSGQTLVQPEGETGWRPLANFPELMPLGTPVPGLAPAPAPNMPLPGFDAKAAVKMPAILLIVAGGLGIVGSLFSIVQHIVGASFMNMNQLPPNMPPQFQQMMTMMMGLGIPFAILGLLLNGVVLFGGISMLSLRRWGLVLAACIIAMACGNPCCCPIGIAAGIWGIIIIVKPEVKPTFQ